MCKPALGLSFNNSCWDWWPSEKSYLAWAYWYEFITTHTQKSIRLRQKLSCDSDSLWILMTRKWLFSHISHKTYNFLCPAYIRMTICISCILKKFGYCHTKLNLSLDPKSVLGFSVMISTSKNPIQLLWICSQEHALARRISTGTSLSLSLHGHTPWGPLLNPNIKYRCSAICLLPGPHPWCGLQAAATAIAELSLSAVWCGTQQGSGPQDYCFPASEGTISARKDNNSRGNDQ